MTPKYHSQRIYVLPEYISKNLMSIRSIEEFFFCVKISEELVALIPRSTEALSNYATILSSIHELSPQKAVKLNGDIENLFRASIEVEGSDMHQDQATPPKHLIETKFWKNITAVKNVDAGKTTSATNKATTGKGASPTKPPSTQPGGGAGGRAPIASKEIF